MGFKETVDKLGNWSTLGSALPDIFLKISAYLGKQTYQSLPLISASLHKILFHAETGVLTLPPYSRDRLKHLMESMTEIQQFNHDRVRPHIGPAGYYDLLRMQRNNRCMGMISTFVPLIGAILLVFGVFGTLIKEKTLTVDDVILLSIFLGMFVGLPIALTLISQTLALYCCKSTDKRKTVEWLPQKDILKVIDYLGLYLNRGGDDFFERGDFIEAIPLEDIANRLDTLVDVLGEEIQNIALPYSNDDYIGPSHTSDQNFLFPNRESEVRIEIVEEEKEDENENLRSLSIPPRLQFIHSNNNISAFEVSVTMPLLHEAREQAPRKWCSIL